MGSGFAAPRGERLVYNIAMRSLLVAAGLAVPQVAFADAVVPADPARSPGFVQIDRYDATSVAGGDFTFISLDDDVTGGNDDLTLLRFQLGGRYVDPRSKLGAYINLPISYASGNDESLTGIGNLELGGIMLPKIGDGSTALALHAGVTLPTGSDGDEAFANAFSSIARPQDVFLAIPEGMSLRLGASPMFRNGNLFGRIDVGVDLNLNNGEGNEADPVIHVNAGLGVDLGSAALMGELSNVYVSSDNDADFSDKLLNVFALSARFSTGNAMPYVSLLIPLDDNTTSALDLAITAGLEARL